MNGKLRRLRFDTGDSDVGPNLSRPVVVAAAASSTEESYDCTARTWGDRHTFNPI